MKNKGPGGMGGGGMNIQKIMAEAQKMQQNLLDIQQNLENEEVDGKSGNGLVTVRANGKHIIKSIKIAKEAVDPDDIEMLEDLVLAAVNDAIKNANNLASERMNSVTGGMNIPGLNNLF